MLKRVAPFMILIACGGAGVASTSTSAGTDAAAASEELPASFQTAQVRGFDNTPADNPTTAAGVALGRYLFYDKALSQNETVACASCHQQAHGFSDPRPLSVGFDGKTTARHSMPVADARFYARGAFFWDERAPTLEAQVLQPIQSDVEMGMTLDALTARLAGLDRYPPLFTAAFGDGTITSDRVSRALAQFVRSIVSYRSRWDAAVAQVSSIRGDLPGFTAEENRGKAIFFGEHDPSTRGLCGTCHLMQNELAFVPPGGGAPAGTFRNTAVFYVKDPESNGLPVDTDLGFGKTTGKATDEHKFKSPSLRNVAARAPYMHDGRFATLEDVVDFYDHGVTLTPNVDPAVLGTDRQPMRLHLSASDKAALVAFLGTLTDDAMATDPRWSDPFR